MFGGSGKVGRGGVSGRGGGAGKRNTHSAFHPPPLHRASSRQSMGGGGGVGPGPGPGPRSSTTSARPSAAGTEETFSLVTGKPLNFAMLIRLAPDLVEEIKREEEQGGAARIKFDANANNSAGNVINVGSKDFRFTWSREPGDLCDIYEERKSGEDGNGMLVESGCAWRKLNVQRVLDESTKNHVKMLSEEAERKLKSRKAIVLDPGNPSMKSQMKALAAAETNPWRMPFKKEPPFKKRKPEPPSGGQPKSMYKSGLSTATPSKGRHSTSPLVSPPEQSGAPASPFGSGSLIKGRTNIEVTNKTTSSEKEMPSKVTSSARWDKRGGKGEVVKPADLRSMLISLLKENPLGMSIKALEKAVGDAFPNSVKQIEPVIKKIATYQAPGKYLLKPGVEIKGFDKPSPEDESSPLDNHHQSPLRATYVQPPAPEPAFSTRTDGSELDELGQLGSKPEEAPNDLEKVDIEHHSPDIFGEKKRVSDSEGPVGSSSDSGSDSDSESDSSDSGSDSESRSRSRSKSRSPVGSGSVSSSDSESDASSNSKEASDEDVDIISSDDDKESKHKLEASEPRSVKSAFAWRNTDGEPGNIEIDEKQHDHVADAVEIEKDLLGDNHVGSMTDVVSSVSDKGKKPEEETKPPSPEWNEHRESQVYGGQSYSGRDKMVKEDPKKEQFNNSERPSKGKSKRGFDEKYFDGKPDSNKRVKAANANQSLVPGTRKSPCNLSPDRPNTQMANITAKEVTTDFASQKGYNPGSSGRSNYDIQQRSQKSLDSVAQAKAPAAVDRPGKHAEYVDRGVKYAERNLQTKEGFLLQRDKSSREPQDDDGFTSDKRPGKFSKEGVGDKLSTPVDSHYRKHDLLGKFKEVESVSSMQMEYSPRDANTNDMDRSLHENGRGNTLQREPSDLELGELREPLPEEIPGNKKPFERKSSFKQSENKSLSSEYWNSDLNKGRSAGKVNAESRKTSPPFSKIAAVSGISEGLKRRNPDSYASDITRDHQGTRQPQSEQHQSNIGPTDLSSHYNKLAEVNSNNRQSDTGMGLETVSLQQQNDSRRGIVSASSRESKKQQSDTSIDLNDRRKDTSLTGSNDGQKRRDSSSDENSCSYSKYEKEEPELKGPIKDISLYSEYVQEYNEKYESYCSLDKILESYRIEFSKLGRDLEASKGRDMERYDDLVAQLKESYQQCGPRLKRLKKIFIVLHEELKHLKQMIKDFAASYTKD